MNRSSVRRSDLAHYNSLLKNMPKRIPSPRFINLEGDGDWLSNPTRAFERWRP